MNTPDFVTTQVVSFTDKAGGIHFIPAGTFVRPIHISYVPKHVLERPRYSAQIRDGSYFCYSSYGIVLVHETEMRSI